MTITIPRRRLYIHQMDLDSHLTLRNLLKVRDQNLDWLEKIRSSHHRALELLIELRFDVSGCVTVDVGGESVA